MPSVTEGVGVGLGEIPYRLYPPRFTQMAEVSDAVRVLEPSVKHRHPYALAAVSHAVQPLGVVQPQLGVGPSVARIGVDVSEFGRERHVFIGNAVRFRPFQYGGPLA